MKTRLPLSLLAALLAAFPSAIAAPAGRTWATSCT